ncbi:MAG: metal-dependent transcriptional regulator [Pseudoclavibacter sp.]|nr:metal-dependent transcriptional regulator [Pseudoclavibacter sp.]
MSVSELSTSTQNYLKVVWALQEWSEEPVTSSTIAARTGLKLSTVSGAVGKLAAEGLLTHAKYGAVSLTERGRRLAVEMIRRHRLIETFLVRELHYGWEEVHDEAEHLEHAVSDLLVDRIDALLGHPSRDPHGDPIPDRDGTVRAPSARRLSSFAPGGRVLVERFSDEDPQLLRFFAERGLVLGAVLGIEPGAPYSDAVEVRVLDPETGEPGEAVPLGRTACDAVWAAAVEEA